MKTTLLLAALVLAAAAPGAFAAEEKPNAGNAAPAPTPAEATEVPAAPGTPEALVEQIQGIIDGEDLDLPNTEKEMVEAWGKRLARFDELVADFRKQFANHPLRWKVLLLEANAREVREELELPVPKESRPAEEVYKQVLAAPDADKATKAQASAARLMTLADLVSEKKHPLEEWEKQVSMHLKSYPDHDENLMLVELRLVLVEEQASSRLVPLLEELAKNSNPQVAELARSQLEKAKVMATLKSKPLELKFKALDGTEIDFEKLRGKVVLVDFWATWCAPCMVEMPNIVQTYQKLKGKGFEVIGISLDEDEAELKRVIKAKEITWPQYFDGKGWENPLAKQYGVDGIPARWLVNKKGMVVDTEADEELAEKVEKLLAE